MIKELLIPKKYENKIRIGENRDGGYVVSKNHLAKKLISVGCNNVTRFESGYLELIPDAQIVIYDPDSACDLAKTDSRVTFKKAFIESFSQLEVKEPCMIQMDIEGSEIKLFNDEDLPNVEMVEQLTLEFHPIMDEGNRNFKKQGTDEEIAAALENLNRYFSLIHIHVNNCGHHYPAYDDLHHPLELTYIKKDDSLPIEDKPFPIEGLDFPNDPSNPIVPALDWWLK